MFSLNVFTNVFLEGYNGSPYIKTNREKPKLDWQYTIYFASTFRKNWR